MGAAGVPTANTPHDPETTKALEEFLQGLRTCCGGKI